MGENGEIYVEQHESDPVYASGCRKCKFRVFHDVEVNADWDGGSRLEFGEAVCFKSQGSTCNLNFKQVKLTTLTKFNLDFCCLPIKWRSG